MATFKAGGKEWAVVIDPWQMKRVRESIGVKLKDFPNEGWKPLWETLADTEKFVDLLFELCRPQIEKEGLTQEQFLRSLAGDEYEAAAHCLVQAFADFCPSQRRGLLTALAMKAKTVADLAATNAMKEVESLTPESLLATLKKSAGDTPASSESMPIT